MGAMRSILEYLLIDIRRGSAEMEIEIEGCITVAEQVLVVFCSGVYFLIVRWVLGY
jgi:hypothetical protein